MFGGKERRHQYHVVYKFHLCRNDNRQIGINNIESHLIFFFSLVCENHYRYYIMLKQ